MIVNVFLYCLRLPKIKIDAHVLLININIKKKNLPYLIYTLLAIAAHCRSKVTNFVVQSSSYIIIMKIKKIIKKLIITLEYLLKLTYTLLQHKIYYE